MSDTLQKLIQDTLTYLKDPLLPKNSLLASEEECLLFQSRSEREKVTISVQPTPPPAPVPVQVVVEAPKVQAAPREEPAVEVAPKSVSKAEPAVPHEQIRKTLQRVAPHMHWVEAVPDDALAQQRASAWKDKISDAEVILLACQRDEETLELLKTLGNAIDKHLAKTKIIAAEGLEKEQRWELFLQANRFKLIVASEGMNQFPGLMRQYRAEQLGTTPTLALSAASIYKSLEPKALLWKKLCQMLKK